MTPRRLFACFNSGSSMKAVVVQSSSSAIGKDRQPAFWPDQYAHVCGQIGGAAKEYFNLCLSRRGSAKCAQSVQLDVLVFRLAFEMVTWIDLHDSAKAGDLSRLRGQDLYADCGAPATGTQVGRLNGRLLLRQDGFGLDFIARTPAPENCGKDGALCHYEPVGNVSASGGRQADGSDLCTVR